MPLTKERSDDLLSRKIGLGGGCHWCTEAVFQALRGVRLVAQGFIQSSPPHDSWSEAVVVHFDPHSIDLATLIEAHLRTHASTSAHRLRNKYRSAIYTFDDEQREQATSALQDIQRLFEKPILTLILDYNAFKSSDEQFQNYYSTNPERPFCRTYIDPKLQLLRDSGIGNRIVR